MKIYILFISRNQYHNNIKNQHPNDLARQRVLSKIYKQVLLDLICNLDSKSYIYKENFLIYNSINEISDIILKLDKCRSWILYIDFMNYKGFDMRLYLKESSFYSLSLNNQISYLFNMFKTYIIIFFYYLIVYVTFYRYLNS